MHIGAGMIKLQEVTKWDVFLRHSIVYADILWRGDVKRPWIPQSRDFGYASFGYTLVDNSRPTSFYVTSDYRIKMMAESRGFLAIVHVQLSCDNFGALAS